eukprot:jgi/Psemu1/17825/gm1.17825_g
MPSLKQLFGSPLGKQKKKKSKDPATVVTKTNSASTINLLQEEDEAERKLILERNYCDDNDEVFDFWNEDCYDVDDVDGHPTAMAPSIPLHGLTNVRFEEQHRDDQGDQAVLLSDVDDDDFRTTVVPSKSLEKINDVCSYFVKNEKEEDLDDDDDDDFCTTVMLSKSKEKINDDCSIVDDDDDDDDETNLDDDDFRTTIMPSKSKERIMDDNDDDDNDDIDTDFRTTVMQTVSVEGNGAINEKQKHELEEHDENCEAKDDSSGQHEFIKNNDDDFRTTVMDLDFRAASSQKQSYGIVDGYRARNDAENYQQTPVNSLVFEKRVVKGQVGSSPANNNSNRRSPFSQNIPPLLTNTRHIGFDEQENCFDQENIAFNDDDDGDQVRLLDFDDYRSTISVLTEATNYVTFSVGNNYSASSTSTNQKPRVPPSPTSSATSAAGTKKMEDFLKTETEALRQLLSTVESGDDESTVVEESVRGANEAERMAREMEREMELLVGRSGFDNENDAEDDGNSDDETSGNHNGMLLLSNDDEEVPVVRPLDYRNLSPASSEFLTDIRSVMHPVASESSLTKSIIEKHHDADDDNESMASSSQYSPTTPRPSCSRDLFRKRTSSYKLKKTSGDSSRRSILKRRTKMKLKKLLRQAFFAVVFVLALCSTSFVAHWQWNHPAKYFTEVTEEMMTLIQQQMSDVVLLDPQKQEKAMAFVTNTTRATHAYVVQKQMELYYTYAPLSNRTKLRVLEGIRDTASLFVGRVTKYRPLVDQTKILVMEGVRDTTSVVVACANNYGPWIAGHAKNRTMDGLRTTSLFFADQLEYYVRNPETKFHLASGIQATGFFLKDRFEYAFTDRAAREERIREEQKFQKLLAAAAAAAAKETAEQQQMLWTQTMVAGACAFAGSVATNFLWSLM